MLEYKKEDQARVVRTLVLGNVLLMVQHKQHIHTHTDMLTLISSPDLRPRGVGVHLIPGLAAHLLFMCVRHADYLNDGNKLKSLMHAIIIAIKGVVTVRCKCLFTTV